MDGGTLVQLRNVINRRNVKKDPSDNMTACEDFFLLVVEAHILTAAMTVFGMRSVDDQPSSAFFRSVLRPQPSPRDSPGTLGTEACPANDRHTVAPRG